LAKAGLIDEKTFLQMKEMYDWYKSQQANQKLKYNRGNSVVKSKSGFWAEITNVNLSNGKCSWQKIKPQAEADFDQYESPFVSYAEWGEAAYTDDYGYAFEINGSTQIVKFDKVFLTPTNEDYYFFEYRPNGKIAQATDDIPAAVSSNYSFSFCRLYEPATISSYTISSREVSFTQYIKIYNMSSSLVHKDTDLQIKYIDRYNSWFVDVEDCG
jgi:hypothetical protein